MAIGNLIFSTSSTTIVTGDAIEASDFERSVKLQVDDVSGNINITGGINTGNVSNFGSNANVKISGGSNNHVLTTDGSSNLRWANVFANVATTKAMAASNVAVTPETLRFFNRSQLVFAAINGFSQPLITSGGFESWTSKIDIIFDYVSTTIVGGGGFRLQLETDSVLRTSGYVSSVNNTLNTSGFLITTELNSGYTYSGIISLFYLPGNWLYRSIVTRSDGFQFIGSGSYYTPSAVLTNIYYNNTTSSIFSSGGTYSVYRE